MARSVWVLIGEHAGHFIKLPDDEAQAMFDSGEGQDPGDKSVPLRHPENHALVKQGKVPKPRRKRQRNRDYQDKMMTAEAED